MSIDAVRRELLKNALVTITDNVLVNIVRTARSANVKNSMDFSAAVMAADGQLAAQGLAVPVHLGAMMPALAGMMATFGDDVHDGDVLALNDPFSGGSHLNDIFMFRPVFVDGRRVAWIGIILHHTDLGGRVAGGNATDSNEIYEEGLRIPPVKLSERGQLSASLMRVIEFNSRVPQRVIADVRAQLAALDQATIELERLVARWGIEAFLAGLDDLIDYAERLTRAGLAALPDGESEFTDWNDDDGAGGPPVKLNVKLAKKGDTLTVDFSGTDYRLGGAVHSNYAFTASCSYAAIRTVLDLDIPSNAGFYRPIEVIAPEGTFVNAPFPAAFGSRGQSGYRIRSVVMGALAVLLPGRLPACTGGSEFAIAVSGLDEKRRRFLHLEFHNTSGHGGGPAWDGQEAGPYCIGNLANMPVELIEAENPLRIEQYAFVPDSEGPGRFRGALGIVREYRLLAKEAVVQVRADRSHNPAWGLFGGKSGSSAKHVLNPGTAGEAPLPTKFIRVMGHGDVVRAEMASSGGYGDPFERDADAVAEDVREGKMSVARAEAEYGVLLARDGSVDQAATAARRARRGAAA